MRGRHGSTLQARRGVLEGFRSRKAHLQPSSDPPSARAEAFGRAFGDLMKRRGPATAGSADPIGLELERLIAEHGVEPAVAEYVRHVVREGFDAAFDAMDPRDAR